MKIKKKIKINDKFIGPIFLIIFIILIIIVIAYINIIRQNIKYQKFANDNMNVYENNKEPVFKVSKILICSSADAVDYSAERNLQDMSIYQYTDIAVYIDNGEELSNKNTVKELYIDSISLEGNQDISQKSLNYKNILKFGQEKQSQNQQNNEKIDFNIIYTNEENEKANYDEPTFYTDCSNPITLEYLNDNIVSHYKMDENKSISFDGSILQEIGITPEQLACKVKFKINIINNNNEKYSCWVNFDIPLDDIYEGTTMKAKTTNNQKYVFFKE